MIGESFGVALERRCDRLSGFGNKLGAFSEVVRDFAWGQESRRDQVHATSIGPIEFDGNDVFEQARFIGIGFGDDAFGVVGKPYREDRIGDGIVGEFVGCSAFDFFLDRFGQEHTQLGSERVAADDRNVDGPYVGAIDVAGTDAVSEATAEQNQHEGNPGEQSASGHGVYCLAGSMLPTVRTWESPPSGSSGLVEGLLRARLMTACFCSISCWVGFKRGVTLSRVGKA